MKKKAYIIILLIILLIIFIVLSLHKTTYKDIIQLSNKLNNINNVILHIENTGDIQNTDGGTFYIKNGIEVIKDENGNTTLWNDIKNNKSIQIDTNFKYIQIQQGPIISYLYMPYSFLEADLNNGFKCNYLKKEYVNDLQCYTIQIQNENELYQYSFSIDTGLLIQEIIENTIDDETSHIQRNYNYTFNAVIDNDIKEIDFNNYKDYKVEEI